MTVRLLAVLAVLLPSLAFAAESKKPGLDVRAELHSSSSPGDLQIPEYPRAERIQRDSDGDGALTVGLTASGDGFHLALAKYRSADSRDAVVAFYQRELGKLGAVTVCDAAHASDAACEDFKSKEGAVQLSVGPKEDRRMVAVTPQKSGCNLVLVRLKLPRAE